MTWGFKMVNEPRSFTVSGRVTESIINKMTQAMIINPEFNQSLQVFNALENMFVSRGITSDIENNVFESYVKRSLLRLEALKNRVNMRRDDQNLGVLVEIITINLRENPKLYGIERDIKELATLIYEIKDYSDLYYESCLKTALNLLKKPQKAIFNEQLKSCIRVNTLPHIIGGTLDTPIDDINSLVSNCMTVPKKHREMKIDEALHYIAQCHEDATNSSQAFLNAIERAERIKAEVKI